MNLSREKDDYTSSNSSLGQFAGWGFTLKLPDDHVLFLMHEGERIAVFSQTAATPESLQAECARHLAESHSKGKAEDSPF